MGKLGKAVKATANPVRAIGDIANNPKKFFQGQYKGHQQLSLGSRVMREAGMDYVGNKVYADEEAMAKAAAEDSGVLTAPTVMPTADDTELAKARRRRIAAQQARSGRASTVLTDSDGLGG